MGLGRIEWPLEYILVSREPVLDALGSGQRTARAAPRVVACIDHVVPVGIRTCSSAGSAPDHADRLADPVRRVLDSSRLLGWDVLDRSAAAGYGPPCAPSIGGPGIWSAIAGTIRRNRRRPRWLGWRDSGFLAQLLEQPTTFALHPFEVFSAARNHLAPDCASDQPSDDGVNWPVGPSGNLYRRPNRCDWVVPVSL